MTVSDHQAADAPHEEDEVRAAWVEFDDPELTALRDSAAWTAKFGYEPVPAVVCAIAPLLHLQ